VPSIRQASFAGGELSPSLYGRSDLAKYAVGLARCRNFVITPQGRALNRVGTTFFASAKYAGPTRIIPFIIDENTSYIIELGALYMRIYRTAHTGGGGGGSAYVEIATAYLNGDLFQIKYAQQGNVMTLVHQNYLPLELTWGGNDSSWTLLGIAFDPPQPHYLGDDGGGGYKAQGPLGVADNQLSSNASGVSRYGAPAPVDSKKWQYQITEVGRYNSGNRNGVVFESAPVAVTKSGVFGDGDARGPFALWTHGATYAANAYVRTDYNNLIFQNTSGGNSTGQWPLTNPGVWTVVGGVGHGRGAGTTLPFQFPRSPYTFYPENCPYWAFQGAYTANPGSIVTIPGAEPRYWVCIADDPVSVDLPPNNPTHWVGPFGPQLLSWHNQDGAEADPGWNLVANNVYAGVPGTMGLLGTTTDRSFVDYGDDPDFASGPPQGRNPFKLFKADGSLLTTENPSVVSFFEQRRLFANTFSRPGWLFGSKVGDFSNFDVHTPGVDSDEFEFQLASRAREAIRSILTKEQMLIFTTGGLWAVTGSQGGPVTRSDIVARKQSEIGASWLDPLLVGDTALYVKSLGAGVIETAFDVLRNAYHANDLTILARHLFEGFSIVDWCYQREPYSTIWAVRSDGVLLSLAYVRDHDVWAWSWHTTSLPSDNPTAALLPPGFPGKNAFESVCSVPNSVTGTDDVYAVVQRVVPSSGGAILRYIELMGTRVLAQLSTQTPPFLDCAKTVLAGGATVIPGFSHLAGQVVMAVIDGNVVGPYTVSQAGTIDVSDRYPDGPGFTGPYAIIAGIPFYSDIQDLDLASPAAELRTKRKNVRQVVVDFIGTRGIYAGRDPAHLRPYVQRQVSDSYNPPGAASGQAIIPIGGDWEQDGRVFIQQKDPLPVEIIGITRQVELGNDV